MTNYSVEMHQSYQSFAADLISQMRVFPSPFQLTVTARCMEPTIWRGDTIVIESMENSAPRLGDVVSFQQNGFVYTHRVVKVVFEDEQLCSIVTKGDNNRLADSPLKPNEILGRVCIVRRPQCSLKHSLPSFPKRTLFTYFSLLQSEIMNFFESRVFDFLPFWLKKVLEKFYSGLFRSVYSAIDLLIK